MNRFTVRRQFTSDVFITDYTQYRSERLKAGATNEELNDEGIPHGVDITDFPSTILDSFHIVNKRHVSITAINFECNMQYFRNADGHDLSQCECISYADGATSKGWLMLHELKYCKSNNIETNFDAAVGQIERTYLHLRDDFQDTPFLKDRQYRYYWVISIPEHSEASPFEGFDYDEDRVLEMNSQYNCMIWGVNQVEVLNTGYLRAIK
jgi:hypothetical protein